MRDRIIEALAREPEEDWRGRLQGQAWYENLLRKVIVSRTRPGADPSMHGTLNDADRIIDEAVTALVREGIVGRSYVYNYMFDPARTPHENNVWRDYFVWLKTDERADWTDRVEAVDRDFVGLLQSATPDYGSRFVFGHDEEVIEPTAAGLEPGDHRPLHLRSTGQRTSSGSTP